MRIAFALALLLSSCRGETVETPVAGDAASDATAEVTPDGSTDTSSADAADVTDVADVGACLLPGSILVNGGFETGTSGWLKNSCKTETIPGPCGGNGIRVFEVINYGSVGQIVARKLPKGTRVRARAYFKASGTLGGTPPYLEVGSIRYVDGGEVREGLGFALADIGPTWAAVEATGVLTEDASELVVNIASKREEADEFAVAAVSLVVE